MSESSRVHAKVSEVLIHMAGQFLSRHSNGESLITVTRAHTDNTGNNVTLFVSVLPDSSAEKAVSFLKRSRSDFLTTRRLYRGLLDRERD